MFTDKRELTEDDERDGDSGSEQENPQPDDGGAAAKPQGQGMLFINLYLVAQFKWYSGMQYNKVFSNLLHYI